MATRKKKASTALAKYDDALAKAALAAADQEAGIGGGQFFSIRGGALSFGDNPIAGNEMAVIIIASTIENVYYEGEYDPEVQRPPACYAFGDDDRTIAPHEEAPDKQAESCFNCELNKFGSRGKGKACKNRRRLALLSAGELDRSGELQPITDADDVLGLEVGYLAVPPTSLKGYATYVKKLASVFKRPPFAVFTRISVKPDPKTQVKVDFELIEPVPDELIEAVIERNKTEQEAIGFPYPAFDDEPPAKKGGRKKTGKKTGKKAPAKKQRKY